jgi:hypothetical protein
MTTNQTRFNQPGFSVHQPSPHTHKEVGLQKIHHSFFFSFFLFSFFFFFFFFPRLKMSAWTKPLKVEPSASDAGGSNSVKVDGIWPPTAGSGEAPRGKFITGLAAEAAILARQEKLLTEHTANTSAQPQTPHPSKNQPQTVQGRVANKAASSAEGRGHPGPGGTKGAAAGKAGKAGGSSKSSGNKAGGVGANTAAKGGNAGQLTYAATAAQPASAAPTKPAAAATGTGGGGGAGGAGGGSGGGKKSAQSKPRPALLADAFVHQLRTSGSAAAAAVAHPGRASVATGAVPASGAARGTAPPAGKLLNPNKASSEAFIVRRGKEREVPKTKKQSRLKKLIVTEKLHAKRVARENEEYRYVGGSSNCQMKVTDEKNFNYIPAALVGGGGTNGWKIWALGASSSPYEGFFFFFFFFFLFFFFFFFLFFLFLGDVVARARTRPRPTFADRAPHRRPHFALRDENTRARRAPAVPLFRVHHFRAQERATPFCRVPRF